MFANLLNLTKTYGKNETLIKALDNINLKINSGEILAITGPSGSGKSTLLNVLGLIDVKIDGDYFLKDKNIKKLNDKELSFFRNKYFGFIIQNYATINDYTVYENVEIPINYSQNKKNKKERVKKILKDLGIEDKINKQVKKLSGGQQQRVAIARALVNNPEVILADEPTGALDKKTGETVLEILKKINKTGKTVVIVTHNECVSSICSRVITLEDGRLFKEIPLQKLNNPTLTL